MLPHTSGKKRGRGAAIPTCGICGKRDVESSEGRCVPHLFLTKRLSVCPGCTRSAGPRIPCVPSPPTASGANGELGAPGIASKVRVWKMTSDGESGFWS